MVKLGFPLAGGTYVDGAFLREVDSALSAAAFFEVKASSFWRPAARGRRPGHLLELGKCE